MLSEIYSRIRSSIVAFVPKYPELMDPEQRRYSHLHHIFGTGFIVGDSLIATNRHVAEIFEQLPRPEGDDNLPVNALLFTRTKGGMGVCVLNLLEAAYISECENTGFKYRTNLPDVALVSVGCRGLSEYAMEIDPNPVSAGTEIATAGFPMGSSLLAPYGSIERFGPVLQRGIISAESPFFGTEIDGYLIDVMVQGGASGSPVFRTDDGKVVGIFC